MEVLGNLDHLKLEIKRSYSEKLADFQGSLQKQHDEDMKVVKEEHERELKAASHKAEIEKAETFRTTYSNEVMKAKRDFELKREKLIANVFEQSRKDSGKVLIDNKYIGVIKNFTKGKDCELIGGDENYKTHFPSLRVDKNILGIIVKYEGKIYDFSFDKFIETNNLELRGSVSRILFENA